MVNHYPHIHPSICDLLQNSVEPVLLVVLVQGSDHVELRGNPPSCNVYIFIGAEHLVSQGIEVLLPIHKELHIAVCPHWGKRSKSVHSDIFWVRYPELYVVYELYKVEDSDRFESKLPLSRVDDDPQIVACQALPIVDFEVKVVDDVLASIVLAVLVNDSLIMNDEVSLFPNPKFGCTSCAVLRKPPTRLLQHVNFFVLLHALIVVSWLLQKLV